jgi:hypothetical protein
VRDPEARCFRTVAAAPSAAGPPDLREDSKLVALARIIEEPLDTSSDADQPLLYQIAPADGVYLKSACVRGREVLNSRQALRMPNQACSLGRGCPLNEVGIGPSRDTESASRLRRPAASRPLSSNTKDAQPLFRKGKSSFCRKTNGRRSRFQARDRA